jgi:5-methylcytosine-specific restriction endonuclease McrA
MRRQVARRADGICEYCLFPESLGGLRFEIDHIIAEKHSEKTALGNLAYACVHCNLAKGSDIGSIHWPSGRFVRFYNPTIDRWSLH